MDIDKAREYLYNKYPKISKPFKLDSDGLFFLDMYKNLITSNIIKFYYNYNSFANNLKSDLDIGIFKKVYLECVSLTVLIGLNYKELDDEINYRYISLNLGDVSNIDFDIKINNLATRSLVLQKSFPIIDHYKLSNGVQIYTGDKTKLLVKILMFDIISKLPKTGKVEKDIRIMLFIDLLINLSKLKKIFNIKDESI